jgi:hypothetical protein
LASTLRRISSASPIAFFFLRITFGHQQWNTRQRDRRADHTDARQKYEGFEIKRAGRWLPAFVCEQAGEKQISATVHTGSVPFCRRLDKESGILTHGICLCT